MANIGNLIEMLRGYAVENNHGLIQCRVIFFLHCTVVATRSLTSVTWKEGEEKKKSRNIALNVNTDQHHSLTVTFHNDMI